MSTKSDWITLDPKEINKPFTVEIGNMKSTVAFQSPLDVPDAIRASFDEDSHTCTIEFKYLIDKEPLIPAETSPGLTILIGKTSKKIYKIELSQDELSKGNAMNTVQTGIQHMESTQKVGSMSRAGNYRVAREALRFVPKIGGMQLAYG